MERVLFLILQVVLWPRVPALFTVEVTKPSHQAEFEGNVTMECRFLPGGSEGGLSVFWRRIHPEPPMEVYRLEKGQEGLVFQDPYYKGRVWLMREELTNGRSVLQISDLRITDSGTYRCLVEMGGVDYKQTVLTVIAPYKSIHKSVKTSERGVELSCESQGYPQASVVWTDSTGWNITKESNVTMATTTDGLCHITSTVTVKSSNNTYTCTFVGEGLMDQSVLFHIPEEIPVKMTEKSSIFFFMFVLIGIITVCVGIVVYCKHKDCKKRIIARPRDCLLPENYAAACLSQETTIEVQTHEGEESGRVESLREVLRSRYAGLTSQSSECFCDKVLPRHLWNRDGLLLEATTLLPGAGESLLLEGEPKSGKTSVALALASAWAQNSEWDPFGVKSCQLVVLVTCEGATGDLFQEAMSQLDLDGELTVSALQEILTGPAEALLVLDGYTFGNTELDKSLGELLRARPACRVLVTALPGLCSDLRELFRTVLLLTQ
ncbi:hypothetical protein SKAU_G00357920 [Synaphobranchus kaupii]|uniref:Ig-like domain-containing protein n=1 Tax=Synaphobranchus kaupii TaxID=118154 RepID=A0A9Q1EHN7_SYNKA|nr:hypothetical protein SKAU_G00357920 [Synaphobranchus kaupii]